MYISIFLPSFQKYDRFVPLELIRNCINTYLDAHAKSRLGDLGCTIPAHSTLFDYVNYAELTISLVLTAQGVGHCREILETLQEMLRCMNLPENSYAGWACDKKALFDRTTNKYTRVLIQKMRREALFRPPSDILSGFYLRNADEIDQQLINDLLTYIADFNNWAVVILDKNYEPGERDMYRSVNNICRSGQLRLKSLTQNLPNGPELPGKCSEPA